MVGGRGHPGHFLNSCHIWSKEQLMQAKNDDRKQWSVESLMHGCMQVYEDDDLHGGQRSHKQRVNIIVNYAPWLPNFVIRSLMMILPT